jgi:hypothetical protein
MAQGNLRAIGNAADRTVAANGVVTHVPAAMTASGERLVPSPVPAALYVPSGRFGGQQLAGSGALVWEGEVVDPSSGDSLH